MSTMIHAIDEATPVYDKPYNEIAAALAAAQAEFKPAVKNATNPHFRNTYADLTSILDATREALCKHGIAFTQSPKHDNGRIVLVSKLIHKSGQSIENEVSLRPAKDDPQGYGSTITYGRRYGAQCLLGINGEDDDDGQRGSTPSTSADPAAALKRVAELEKMLEFQAELVKRSQRFSANIDLMLRFESKFHLSHKNLADLCAGRSVKDWTDADVEVLRAAGVQLLKGDVTWQTIIENASASE